MYRQNYVYYPYQPQYYPYPVQPVYYPQYHQYSRNDYRQNGNSTQQYPDIDPTTFSKSAEAFKTLMGDASMVLDRLANSKTFAKKVMSAAQESQLEEVDRLIQSTGISSNFETSFNPDGIHLKFTSEVEGTECCKLDMAIRWR